MFIYELTCVFSQESDSKKLVKKIEDWLKEIGAKIEKKEDWGKKELAYRIKKNSQGHYVFWQIKTEPSKVGGLFPKIKLESEIIRHLLVRTS